MGLKRWLTHKIMGNRGIVEETTQIIDGVIMSPIGEKASEKEEKVDKVEEIEWVLPEDYIEHAVKRGLKERTAKEYAFDLKAFGVCLDTITIDQIKNRIRGLAESNKRRKLTALRSYAKYSLRNGNSSLFITLAEFNIKDMS